MPQLVYFVLLQVLIGGPAADAPVRATVTPPVAASLLDRASALGTTAVDQAASVRVQVSRDVAVEAIVLRDFGAHHEAMVTVSAAHDFGRLRLTFAERVDHTFIAGRDAVDLYTAAGASWQVAQRVRLGVDYVAQDLEDVLGDDSDAGLRQTVAADAQLQLRDFVLTAGPTVSAGAQPLGFFAAVGRTF